MNIEVTELEILFKKIISKLNEDGITNIEVENDFYRFISADDWDNYESEILVGSLNDDIESLKKNIKDDDRPFSYVDFDRLSFILRYISNKEAPIS